MGLRLPVIDVGPLVGPGSAAARARVAGQIQAACRERGFFYVTGHGVPAGLLDQLAEASAEFSPCRWPTSWRSPWSAAALRGGGSFRSAPS
jgi:isopenicillin N synthase-like dioxygenase